ncbi:MAG: NAD(P)-dependent oxidoreductase [Rhodovarius sp.]|nr:NAD(P)-dependent oxidoreductase [Rhodovarius sp.]
MGQVGLIGLGRMGGAMLARLVATGPAPLVWDESPPALARAAAAGGLPVQGPAGAAAPVVLLSLPDAGAVEAVLAPLLPALPAGAVVVDCSTLDPAAARAFAARAAGHGIAYLDAPVSGGPAGAAAGTLTMMLGGEEAAIARARPVLERLAQRILHIGPAGAGQLAKLVNNLLVATHLVVAGEALGLARRAGLPPEVILPVINTASGRSAVTEVNWPRWILPGGFDSGFTAGLMRKDLRLALALADALNAALPVCRSAAAAWQDQALPDEADFNRLSHAIAMGDG